VLSIITATGELHYSLKKRLLMESGMWSFSNRFCAVVPALDCHYR